MYCLQECVCARAISRSLVHERERERARERKKRASERENLHSHSGSSHEFVRHSDTSTNLCLHMNNFFLWHLSGLVYVLSSSPLQVSSHELGRSSRRHDLSIHLKHSFSHTCRSHSSSSSKCNTSSNVHTLKCPRGGGGGGGGGGGADDGRRTLG